MGTLRNRMTDAMKLRRFSPRTQQSYLAAVTALANYYRTPPDQLDFEKIKAYLLHLTVERALSWSTCNVAVSAFRFFYVGRRFICRCRHARNQRRSQCCLAARNLSGSLLVPRRHETASC